MSIEHFPTFSKLIVLEGIPNFEVKIFQQHTAQKKKKKKKTALKSPG